MTESATTPIWLDELHTSDLTASCPRSVQLKHEGHAIGETGEALYKGWLAHYALEWLHMVGSFEEGPIHTALDLAEARVDQTAEEEGRPLSDSVMSKRVEYRLEIAEMLGCYGRRVAPQVKELIGVEVPCRFTLVHPRIGTQEFASHLDLLFRDEHGMICVWDWKYQHDEPSYDYLHRNLQFGLYYRVISEGHVLIGGEWMEPQELPEIAWIDLPRLAPYKRGNKAKGVEKGDERPLKKVIRRVHIYDEHAQTIDDELALRTAMCRDGYFPTNPDKIGCRLCEVNHVCPDWGREDSA